MEGTDLGGDDVSDVGIEVGEATGAETGGYFPVLRVLRFRPDGDDAREDEGEVFQHSFLHPRYDDLQLLSVRVESDSGGTDLDICVPSSSSVSEEIPVNGFENLEQPIKLPVVVLKHSLVLCLLAVSLWHVQVRREWICR